MKTVTFKQERDYAEAIASLTNRFSFMSKDLVAQVELIVEKVSKDGDQALLDYTSRLDGVSLTQEELPVSPEERKSAYLHVRPEEIEIMNMSIVRIRDFHRRQSKQSWFFSEEDGVVLGQLIQPMERVGLYVPGGKASYPSSVIMGAVPAQVAGVKEIIMVSPPRKDKTISPYTLVAADLLGIDKIYKVGGAQAIAALAYGTQSIPSVQKIVGPGNVYVTMAKKQVFGRVDIDMLAGPSEVLVLADQSATPEYVAADLLSQAEHDQRALTILVTPELNILQEVEKEVVRQLEELERKEIAQKSLQDYSYLFHTKDMEEALRLTNIFASEHLILAVANPFEILPRIHHAGSIFLGHYTPETLGDYVAGPNHVLPTSGTARFFSSLGVEDFYKRSGFTYWTKPGLEKIGPSAIAFAELEGLTAHAAAVRRRLSPK